jgi:hypothetical protein
MEPLLDIDPMGYHRTVARLLRAIDPALTDWYTATSRTLAGVLLALAAVGFAAGQCWIATEGWSAHRTR